MKIFKIFLVLFCVIGFAPKILANDSLVLECFSLTGNYEFRYYGIKKSQLYYINKKKEVKEIPYDNIKIKEYTMFAITPESMLGFTFHRNTLELKRTDKRGDTMTYACSRLKGKFLKDFIK